jgi:hypothetical protein
MTKEEFQTAWTDAFIHLIMTKAIDTELLVEDQKPVIVTALNNTIHFLLSEQN